jgi:hypothetical protein
MILRASVTLALAVSIGAVCRPAVAQESEAPEIFANLDRYLPTPAPEHRLILLPPGESRVLQKSPWQLRRPDRFETLCFTLAALTVVDTVTTSRALNDGTGRELNPILAPFASNTYALAATKTAVDVAAVYLARRLWRRDHGAAVNVLIAANAMVGVAVVKNVSVTGSREP